MHSKNTWRASPVGLPRSARSLNLTPSHLWSWTLQVSTQWKSLTASAWGNATNSPHVSSVGLSTSPSNFSLQSPRLTSGSLATTPGCSTPHFSMPGIHRCLGGRRSWCLSSFFFLQNKGLMERLGHAVLKASKAFIPPTSSQSHGAQGESPGDPTEAGGGVLGSEWHGPPLRDAPRPARSHHTVSTGPGRADQQDY